MKFINLLTWSATIVTQKLKKSKKGLKFKLRENDRNCTTIYYVQIPT